MNNGQAMTTRRTFLFQALCTALLGLTPVRVDARGKGGGPGKGGPGNGGGAGKGQAGKAAAKGKGKGKAKDKPARSKTSPEPGPENVIRHGNGMQESIRDGRYEMRDARNRSIVNRRATQRDYQRLRKNGN
jgi:hypothetical protein